MSSENSKKALPVVKNSETLSGERYADAAGGVPKCGSCIWLRQHHPRESSACADLKERDEDGKLIVIGEKSPICKDYLPKSDGIENLFQAFMVLPLEDVIKGRKIIGGIIKAREEEAACVTPIEVNDEVEFTLSEGTKVTTYVGNVMEKGRGYLMVAIPNENGDGGVHLERIPRTLATLKLRKSAIVGANAEIRKIRKSDGSPEEIRKAQERSAKTSMKVLRTLHKITLRGSKPMRGTVDKLVEVTGLEQELVVTTLNSLRDLKMVLRKEGKYKASIFGAETCVRLNKAVNALDLWKRICARKSSELKSGK